MRVPVMSAPFDLAAFANQLLAGPRHTDYHGLEPDEGPRKCVACPNPAARRSDYCEPCRAEEAAASNHHEQENPLEA